MAAVATASGEAPASGWFRLPRRRRRSETEIGRTERRVVRSRTVDLSLYRKAQLALTAHRAGDDPRLFSVSLRLARSAEDHRQPRDPRRRQVSAIYFRLRIRPDSVSDAAVRRLSGDRADQRRLQVLHQHVQGPARRADAAALPLSALPTPAALSADPLPENLGGADHSDGHGRIRIARRLYRRRFGAASVSGRNAADDHRFHVRAGSGARAGRDRALSVSRLYHPEIAAEGEPTQQAARAHPEDRRRPHPGIGRRHRRNPQQRHGQAAPDRFRRPARPHLRHPVRDLQAQVLCQIPQQFYRAADAVFLLFDRRLSGDPRQSVVRRAGRGARGL